MAFNSCENENVNESFSNDGTVTMNFVAGVPESRTSVAIDGNAANYSWSKGDKVGFYYVATNPGVDYKKKGNSDEAVIADDGTATFSMTFKPSAEATTYNVGAFYPGMSWVSSSHSTENPFNNVKVQISAKQNLVKGTFDPAADLMMSKPFIGIALSDQATVHTLEFSRIAAIGKMNLTLTGAEADEYIKSVVFTLANGNHFNGPVMLDLENGTYEIVESETTNAVSLSGTLETASGSASVFFTCLPGDFTGAYTIEVSTNKANYSKEGTLSKTLSFTAGDVLGFNATVGNREEVAEEESLAGDYIIVAKRSSSDNFFYMTTSLTTSSTKRVAAVNTNSTTVDGVAIKEDYVWTVAKSGATYTMQTPGGKYLTWTSGNSANFADTAGDNTALRIVAGETEGTYNVKFNQDPSKILSFNNTTNNDYFAFYAGTQVNDLYFIPVTPADPNAPTLSLDKSELSFEVAGGSQTVTATTTNYEGAITASSDNSHFSVSVVGNVVTVTAPKNEESTEQTATITINAGDLSQTVSVSQKAAAAAGVQKITVAEFIAEADTETYYELTGVVSNVTNTTYGNFDLTDASGTILVYGLYSTDGSQNKYWAASGVKEGDTITIQGQYKLFGTNTHEVVNARYISHISNPKIIPATKEYSVAAAGDTFTVALTTENLPANVSATSNVSWIVVNSVSNTSLSFTVNANESSDGREGVITLTSGAVSATITVNQFGKQSSTAEDITLDFNTISKKVGAYTQTWEQVCGNYNWSMVNFNNNNAGWKFVKCGRKSDPSVASIGTKFSIPWAVSSVVVTVDNVLDTSKVNSTKLQVATDANFSNVVETVTVTIAKGNMTYTIANPGANYYYRLVYDCKAHGKSNGNIQISKVVYKAQ